MNRRSFAVTIFTALLLTILAATASFAQTETPVQSDEKPAEAPMPENAMAIRIGVALPKANFSAPGVTSTEMAASIREMIGGYFKGTEIEIVALEARLPQAITAEAKEKSCFYILQTSVSKKKSGSFNSVAPVLGAVAPISGMSGTVAGAVTRATLYTAADLASTTKAKDEFTFEYNLTSTDDDQVKAKNSFKAKAKSDGEDVITPMLEKMMPAILAAAK